MLGFSTDILPVSELVCSQLAVIRSMSCVKMYILKTISEISEMDIWVSSADLIGPLSFPRFRGHLPHRTAHLKNVTEKYT